MNPATPLLTLFRDQIWGWYARVPAAEVEAVQQWLEYFECPYAIDPEGADRLRREGFTVFAFGSRAQELEALTESGIPLPSEYTLDEQSYRPPVSGLFGLPPLDESEGADGGLCDYAALGLAREHLPELQRLVNNPEWDDTLNGDAPFHAVHAIAALGGIDGLLGLWREARATDREWLWDELGAAMAACDASALPALADYLADESAESDSKIAVVEAMLRVVQAHPEGRDFCIERMVAQLARYAVQDPLLNGFLVAGLSGLGATEALPLIERAFADKQVDELATGDWEDVQIAFGVKTRRERPRSPSRLKELLRSAREQFELPAEPAEPFRLPAPKVGRNDPCPCGSGKKYKKCCGA